VIRTPRKKFIKHYDESWRTVDFMVEHGLLQRSESTFFLNSPYLQELYDIVHTNMLFNWLTGDYGYMDTAIVPYDDIKKAWRTAAHDHGYFGRSGAVMEYYVQKEVSFWKKLLNPSP